MTGILNVVLRCHHTSHASPTELSPLAVFSVFAGLCDRYRRVALEHFHPPPPAQGSPGHITPFPSPPQPSATAMDVRGAGPEVVTGGCSVGRWESSDSGRLDVESEPRGHRMAN